MSKTQFTQNHVPVWLRVLGAILFVGIATLAIAALRPPDVPLDAGPAEFSAARALAATSPILMSPRTVGTPAHDAAAAWLASTLRDLGLEVDVQEDSVCTETFGHVACAHTRNVIGRLHGQSGARAVALVAHYDSVSNTPGAGDDGFGLATLIETARALRAGPPLRNDVLFVFDDAEESGLLGAVAFTRDHPWHRMVRMVLNFDARGTSGASVMYDTSPDNGALALALADTPRPVSSSLILSLSRIVPNGTDGLVFKSVGDTTMCFAFIDGFENYHRGTDTLDRLDPRSLQHNGSYALTLARRFGDSDLDHLRAPSRVYFDVFARSIIAYSPAIGLLLTALGCLLYLITVARARLAGVAAGFAWSWLALLSAISVSASLSWVVRRCCRLEISLAHPALMVTPHVVLGAAVVAAILCRAARRRTPLEIGLGGFATWALAAIATAAWAPGAGFVFHIPLLFAATGMCAATLPLHSNVRFTLACAGAIPTVYFLTVLGFTTLLEMGAAVPSIPAACAYLMVVLVWYPLAWMMRGLPRNKGVVAWGVASLASICTLVVAQYLGLRTPHWDDLRYFFDADSGRASWTSYDASPDDATRTLLGDRPIRGSDGGLYREAPVFTRAPPHIEFLGDEVRTTTRTISMRIQSPRGARCILIYETSGAHVLKTRVDGYEPRPVFQFSPETDRRLAHTFLGAPTDTSWSIDLCAPGQEGFLVELELDREAHPHFQAWDRSAGLPAEAPRFIRPPGFAAASESDETVVGKSYDPPTRTSR